MRSRSADQPLPPRPAGRRCRRCGCTDREACVVEWGQRSRGRPPVDLVERTLRSVPRRRCTWVGPDLCSRCLRPGELTAAQAGEVGRIRARFGPVRVTPGAGGSVFVTLTRWTTYRVEEVGPPGDDLASRRRRKSRQISSPCPVLEIGQDGRCRGVSNPQPHPLSPPVRYLERMAREERAA